MYRIGSRTLEPASEAWPAALAYAHEKGLRPMCTCRPQGVPMYVARYADGFLLKRMPNSGASHAPHCLSYDGDDGLALRARLQKTGAATVDEGERMRLRLSFPLSHRERLAPASKTGAAEPSAPQPVTQPPGIDLASLLWLLVEESGLNRWSSASGGARRWPFVYRAFLEAAARVVVKRLPLSERLLIPAPFHAALREQLFAERRAFLVRQLQGSRRFPLVLVVGELKSLQRLQRGARVWLRHMPERALLLPEAIHEGLDQRHPFAFGHWRDGGKLLVAMVAAVTPAWTLEAEAMAILPFNDRWTPIQTPAQAMLVRELQARRRDFLVTAAGPNQPDAILLDTADAAPLYVGPSGVDDGSCWLWHPGRAAPPLPVPMSPA